MNRRNELLAFISGLYIPVGKREEYATLRNIVLENDYRPIQDCDSMTMKKDCLIIETHGRGLYETFQGFHVTRVDIGEVGEKFADVAIYYPDIEFVIPQRIAKSNIKINVPNE